jgi:tRNA (Thr-GGU) A37 N-methylase
LADVASLDRIWLIFLFDKSKGWAAKVKPPRGGAESAACSRPEHPTARLRSA